MGARPGSDCGQTRPADGCGRASVRCGGADAVTAFVVVVVVVVVVSVVVSGSGSGGVAVAVSVVRAPRRELF